MSPVEATNLLVDSLLEAGRRTPDKVAVRSDGASLTFAELDVMSAQMAHVLRGRYGVSRGDRVAVQLAKCPEVLALNVACARVGALYVPVNPSYTDREVSDLLDDASPALLVRDDAIAHATPRVGIGELLVAASGQPSTFADEPCDAHAPAAMLFTSGTTGRPKGAVLSHGNLTFGFQTLNRVWGISPEDRLVHILPLFHVHGLFVAAYCSLSAGADMGFIDRFDVGRVREALHGATVLMGVPTHYTRLLADESFSARDALTMRLFVSGSAPLRRATYEEFLDRTGHRILERYGTTETGMVASNPVAGERKPGTVGVPLPGVDVRVTGGPPGAIEVRGPNVFSGYWNRPELRETVFTPDGFFRTGDLGVLDEDGYLEIVGRSADLVISGGLNVYPREVEQVLDEAPGVVESAVVGLPDPDLGEAVTAFVVLDAGMNRDEEGLRRFVRGRLAPYKVPKRFVFVDELPRNSMGKVQKARLRQSPGGDPQRPRGGGERADDAGVL